MIKDITDYIDSLSWAGLGYFVLEIFGALIGFLFIVWLLKEKLIKKPRKYTLSTTEARKVQNLKIHPSQSHYIYAATPSRRKVLLTRMVVKFEGSYSKYGKRQEGGDMTIGKYGERAFGRSNPSARAELLIASDNFKGFIDYSMPDRVVEIKTTDYRGIISSKYENKWMFQLGCYVHLTKKPGTLQVYQHIGKGNVKVKYKKYVNVNSKLVSNIAQLDKQIASWKQETAKQGFIWYKPKNIFDGLRLWFGGDIKLQKKGKR